MSLLLDAMDHITTELTNAGLNVVLDPRNVTPPCVLIDPPSVRAIKGTIVTADVRITVLAPPPGNRDAMLKLLTDADTIIEAAEVIDGSPGTYTIGTQDLPAYSLTARITLIRN